MPQMKRLMVSTDSEHLAGGWDTFVFPRQLQTWENCLHRFALSRVWTSGFPKTLELLLALLGVPFQFGQPAQRQHAPKAPALRLSRVGIYFVAILSS